MVDIIIRAEYKVEIAELVSQVVHNLDHIGGISFRHPVLIPEGNSGVACTSVAESGSDVDKSFGHVIVQEVQEFPVGAEIELQVIGGFGRELCPQAQHHGIVYFHTGVLGGEEAATFQLIGIHEVKIIILQGQEIL